MPLPIGAPGFEPGTSCLHRRVAAGGGTWREVAFFHGLRHLPRSAPRSRSGTLGAGVGPAGHLFLVPAGGAASGRNGPPATHDATRRPAGFLVASLDMAESVPAAWSWSEPPILARA